MLEPLLRRAARAIVIDEQGRTLLFRARVPGPRERYIWITPGGGIDEGEDESDCVRRELFEETGLAGAEIGPCVWRRDHTFLWDGRPMRQVEAYYVVRAASFQVDTAHHEELERTFLSSHRWFALEELRAHEETLVPANFAELLEPLLAGQYPEQPIVVGI
jgi:8-oxo-dGTP pyrophosphatase MutT (NUDIX family)